MAAKKKGQYLLKFSCTKSEYSVLENRRKRFGLLCVLRSDAIPYLTTPKTTKTASNTTCMFQLRKTTRVSRVSRDPVGHRASRERTVPRELPAVPVLREVKARPGRRELGGNRVLRGQWAGRAMVSACLMCWGIPHVPVCVYMYIWYLLVIMCVYIYLYMHMYIYICVCVVM